MDIVGNKIVALQGIEKQALTLEKATSDIRDVHKIQGNDGNWNHDQYMHGMYNGLELAMCILEQRDPDFRSLKEEDALLNKPNRNRKHLAVGEGECLGIEKFKTEEE